MNSFSVLNEQDKDKTLDYDAYFVSQETLNLIAVKTGASIAFVATKTFGTRSRPQRAPVFFEQKNVVGLRVARSKIKSMPFRTFSGVTSKDTTLSGLTIDNRAGNGITKNTGGDSHQDGVARRDVGALLEGARDVAGDCCCSWVGRSCCCCLETANRYSFWEKPSQRTALSTIFGAADGIWEPQRGDSVVLQMDDTGGKLRRALIRYSSREQMH
ncbi:hypothetical protein PHYSODRAFT_258824 [Phytophthora sojae]|uniref:Uncharacterized protein n=1 Tax=Phytophthora sojae (strain P6497) TaxID=1094619 RepID=G5AD07_PHYSP|nr:hypothetical protein PHYSODRAFT_258824 [Phytophthora sojae]EGZ06061.1 hypothetical protein PHYSODRAFT_258824 [Phytophthora sojae]|eukprot:XP_009537958.1 hypothetical protein PHYSODRAFT_258824 [Phytophthora sojae]